MKTSQQIAVTGIGVLCPLGDSPEELLAALRNGKGAIDKIRSFPTDQLAIKHAAEIHHFDPLKHFNESELANLDRTAQLGIVAAKRAIEDAGLGQHDVASTRLGVVIGICAGGQGDPPNARDNPFEIRLDNFPETAIFAQADAIVSALGTHGPSNCISTACASSGSALGVAFEWLQTGRCDRVIVGGTDAFSVFTYAGFYALGAMAPEPTSPFSEGIGVTFGEGAGFVILESVDSALRRGAKIYGELLGYGLTGDAHHVTSPHPGGEGLNRAMRRAIACAGLQPSDIDYVNAHGTGTRDNDSAETQAIRELYGASHLCPPVSSSKSFFGHTLGAAGILEFIVSLLASREDLLPPTINFVAARQGCDLDYVPNACREAELNAFVSNSAAFGGVNASIVGGKLRSQFPSQPMVEDEIWITGTGVVSPIGCGSTDFFQALRNSTTGITKVDAFPVEGLRTAHAALVPDFNARKLIPTIDTRRAERMNRFAMVAAGLALQTASLNMRSIDPTRYGLIMGLHHASISVQEQFRASLLDDGIENLSAKYFPSMVVSTIAGQVAQTFKLQGINNTVVDGITSGLKTLTHGFEMLRQNDSQDGLVVVAGDEVGSLMFRVLAERGWTTESSESDPALNLYGHGTGFIVGEGAGAMLIERASAAKARNANPLAKVCGWGATNDATATGKPDPSGVWLKAAIQTALIDAQKSLEEIDWIVTHGRGVPENDEREASVLQGLFGDRCPPVSCLVGHVGVAGASVGMMSLVAAVLGMQQQELFPTLGLAEAPMPLPFVHAPQSRPIRNVLVIGSSEHGANTAVVLESMLEVSEANAS